MSARRHLRLIAVLATGLSLVACASLPTTGEVRPGLSADGSRDGSDVTYVPAGPVEGADPEQIVRGFLEAASSPADNWAIAREFFSVEAAEKWKPQTGVTIDASAADRRFSAQVSDGQEGSLHLGIRQTASVDENGVYTPVDGAGSAELVYQLTKDGRGQWRISAAPDGILLTAESFDAADVFSPYAVQYFDPSWTYLVPDVRWFPKRKNTATRIVQSLVSGAPSPMLVEAVRTAFTGDIELARDAVAVTSQVAEVELTAAALEADPTVLSRMRTQLERSLSSLGVMEVRLSVAGRSLPTPAAPYTTTAPSTSPLVLTENGFGHLVGGEVKPVDGLSSLLVGFSQPLRAIVASGADRRAIVQTLGGAVYAVGGERVDEIDSRPGLLVPSLDPQGFVWTAVGSSPGSVMAWSPAVVPHPLPAFGDASSVAAMAVSRDGARLGAVVTVGSQKRVVVAGIVRDERGTPTAIGAPTTVGLVRGTALGLTWLDDTTLGTLVDDDGEESLVEQVVGGPMTETPAPAGATTVAPMTPSTTTRLLDANGNLLVRSGPTWRKELGGVRILATQIDAL